MNFVFYPDLPAFPDLPLIPSKSYYQSLVTPKSGDNGAEDAPADKWATRFKINGKVIDWIRNNIDTGYDSIGLNHHNVTNDSNIPHVDKTRNWILMWILDTGGEDVHTVYWQEKGFGVIREPGCYPRKNHDLIEIENHVFEPGRWILMSGNVIHSVENIQHTRKSIQIGFWNDADFVIRHTRQQ